MEDADLQGALAKVQQQYPAFKGLPVKVQRGSGKGQLEFYAPDESRNPNPGAITIEIRNPKLQGPYLESAIAGDLLHYVGGTTGGNFTPNSLPFHQQKNEFIRRMTPEQRFILEDMYRKNKEAGDINPQMTLDDFTNFSGADAFIRGYLFPDEQDEWRKPGFGAYTPEQKTILEKMRSLLTREPAP